MRDFMWKRLNILIVLNNMGVGGSQIYNYVLAEELKAKGHKIIIMSWGGSLVEKLEELNIKHYELPFNNFSQLYIYLRTVQSRLKKALYFILTPFFIYTFILSTLNMIKVIKKEKINVIHSNQPIPTLMAILLSRLTHIPIVTTVHGPGVYEFPPYAYQYINKYTKIINNIEKIISISEEIKCYLTRNYRVDEKKIVVIPNGINFEKFFPRTYMHQGNGAKTVLFLSGSSNYSVVTDLIQATPVILSEVPNCKIIIIGGGSQSLSLSRTYKLAEKINGKIGKDAIVVLGVNSYDKIPQLLNQSTIVIGTGRAILEAMACGKAAIVAGAQGFGGLVTRKNLKKLKFHNFSGRGTKMKARRENMAENIIKILNDTKLKDSLELFSREVANDFDIKSVARRIEEIYHEVIV